MGIILRAPINAKGMANIEATSVPKNAIETVSAIANKYSAVRPFDSGGTIKPKTSTSFNEPLYNRSAVTSSSDSPNKNNIITINITT
jgi:hypothetical protein